MTSAILVLRCFARYAILDVDRRRQPLQAADGASQYAEGSQVQNPAHGQVGTRQLVMAYLGLVVVTSSLEGIWYLGIAADLYNAKIGPLMNVQFDVPIAVLFYLFYALGAMIFALRPALRLRSLRHAVGCGALYGFFCFAAHNLTDLADVKGFSWEIALVDIAWGTAMTAVSSLLAFRLARCVARREALGASPAQPG